MRSRIVIGGLLGSLALIVAACSTPASSNAGARPEGAGQPANENSGAAAGATSGKSGYAGADSAKLSVHLVDAPTDEVTSIVVTIAKIEASVNDEWLTLSETEHTVDLLTLQNGAFLDLGSTAIPPGHVEQVRLKLAAGADHHILTLDGQRHSLVVPSGEQSGIKLVGGFDLAPCSTAQLTIDFDGKRSLHRTGPPKGTDGQWILQPVVRIVALVAAGTCEQPDAGETEAGADAGEAILVDTCADITCADTEICENGTCRAAE